MMLAKFNCSPIATQISSVTTMATMRGTSVSATSLKRRSATKRISAIDASDQTAASRNALTMVAAASTMKIGVPVASRRDPADRFDEAAQDGVVVSVSSGHDLDPDLTAGRDPGAPERGRKRVDRHMLRGQEIPHLAKRRHQRGDQNALRFVSFRRRCAFAKAVSKLASRRACTGGGAVDSGRRAAKDRRPSCRSPRSYRPGSAGRRPGPGSACSQRRSSHRR